MSLGSARFKILKEFKSNRHTQVNLVEERQTSKLFILKKIHITDFNKQFREVQIHNQLNHKHIIKLLEYQQTDHTLLLLIEYAKYEDLFSWMTRLYLLSEDSIIRFYKNTVEAIVYLHSKDIVHRDIKPENILVSRHFSPRLADFGSSAFKTGLGRSMCGTLEYMSPEVLQKKEQTEKIDIWGLGILLFEIFHEFTPFKNLNSQEIIEIVSNHKISFRENLNLKVKFLILRLLKIDPNERPSAEQILNDPLFQELDILTQKSSKKIVFCNSDNLQENKACINYLLNKSKPAPKIDSDGFFRPFLVSSEQNSLFSNSFFFDSENNYSKKEITVENYIYLRFFDSKENLFKSKNNPESRKSSPTAHFELDLNPQILYSLRNQKKIIPQNSLEISQKNYKEISQSEFSFLDLQSFETNSETFSFNQTNDSINTKNCHLEFKKKICKDLT